MFATRIVKYARHAASFTLHFTHGGLLVAGLIVTLFVTLWLRKQTHSSLALGYGALHPFIRDGVGCPQLLGEEGDPQLLYHPADIGHLRRDRLGFGDLGEQRLVVALHALHLEHMDPVPVGIDGQLLQTSLDGTQIAQQVRQSLPTGLGDEALVDQIAQQKLLRCYHRFVPQNCLRLANSMHYDLQVTYLLQID